MTREKLSLENLPKKATVNSDCYIKNILPIDKRDGNKLSSEHFGYKKSNSLLLLTAQYA